MRGVRGEAPLGDRRALEPVEQGVDDVGEAADFVVGFGCRQAPIQIVRLDGGERGAERRHRRKRAAGKQVSAGHAQDEQDRHDQQKRVAQTLDRLPNGCHVRPVHQERRFAREHQRLDRKAEVAIVRAPDSAKPAGHRYLRELDILRAKIGNHSRARDQHDAAARAKVALEAEPAQQRRGARSVGDREFVRAGVGFLEQGGVERAVLLALE